MNNTSTIFYELTLGLIYCYISKWI